MSRRITYGRIKCRFCERMITTSGLGFTSHNRKHVREGVAVERIDHGCPQLGIEPTYTYEPKRP